MTTKISTVGYHEYTITVREGGHTALIFSNPYNAADDPIKCIAGDITETEKGVYSHNAVQKVIQYIDSVLNAKT